MIRNMILCVIVFDTYMGIYTVKFNKEEEYVSLTQDTHNEFRTSH